MSFRVWITPLQIIFSSYIHLLAKLKMSLTFIIEKYSIVQIYHIFVIHSSLDEHLGHFQFLAIKNKAAMNITEQVILWYTSTSFWNSPRSGKAGYLGRIIPSFLRKLQIGFLRGRTCLPSNQHWRSVLETQPHQKNKKCYHRNFLLQKPKENML